MYNVLKHEWLLSGESNCCPEGRAKETHPTTPIAAVLPLPETSGEVDDGIACLSYPTIHK